MRQGPDLRSFHLIGSEAFNYAGNTMMDEIMLERIENIKCMTHKLIDDFEFNCEKISFESISKHIMLQKYLLSQKLNSVNLKNYFANDKVKFYIKKFRELNANHEINIEMIMSDILISGKSELDSVFSFLKTYYSDFYKLLSCNEALIYGSKKIKKICMVGIGTMPLSLLFTQAYSKAKVVGLDISEDAIFNANRFLKFACKTKPEKYSECDFDLYCMDGDSYNYKDVDVVILSIYVKNKHLVLKKILQNFNEKSLIIIDRGVDGLRNYFYEYYPFDIEENPFRILKCNRTGIINSTGYTFK